MSELSPAAVAERPTVIRYRRPPLYAKQVDAIFTPARYAVTEASTKSGKTYGCIVWLLEKALLEGRPNRHYWWTAPSASQALIAYGRMKRAVRHLPGVAFYESAPQRIDLPNGAVVDFRTAEKPDNLYGEDVYAIVLDEATRMRPAVWAAIRTTITATRGQVRIIGNVVGSRNWAYQMARRAEQEMRDGNPDWHYAKITAYDAVDAGILDAAEIADAKAANDARIFQELYLAEPAESLSLIYANFTNENIDDEADYDPGGGELYVSYDWGFTDNTHITLWQLADGVLYGFDELVGNGQSEDTWARSVVQRIVALPDYEGPVFEDWEQIWRAGAMPLSWPQVWPVAAAGDPSAVQMRATLKQHGIGAMSAKRVTHKVVSGQDVVRAVIRSAADGIRFVLHPRCVQTIAAFQNYRATELEDGSYDPRPDPGPENHAYSHGCDSARYLIWPLRRRFGIKPVGGEE